MSTLQVDLRPRSVLLQFDVDMKQTCETNECILDGVGHGYTCIIFEVNLAYKILINLSVFHRMKYLV